MKTKNKATAKRGVISPHQLFFIFLVSRAVVALTFYQAILINGITPDTLISSLLALGINLLICLPAFLCVKYDKNPLDSGLGRIIFLFYFVFFAGVNVSRFAFFACEKTSGGESPLLFILIMTAAACYAAYLGIEALGRFSVLCAVFSVLLLTVIIILNFKNFHGYNFMPFFEGKSTDIFKNSLVFSSNSVEAPLFLLLNKKCSKETSKPLFLGIIASYLAILLMLLFCIGVLGKAATLFSFPVYTLFQMTSFKSFSRLDIVYSAFGFFAFFAKCAVLVYCADELTPIIKQKAKPLASFISVCIASLLIYQRFYSEIAASARLFYAVISIAFTVVIPCLYLVFKKRKKAEYEKKN